MNILISNLHLFLISGGGEKYIEEIAKKLQERGHNITIATGIPFFNLKKPTPMRDIGVIWCRHFYLRNIALRMYNFSHFIKAVLSRIMLSSYSFSFFHKIKAKIKDFDVLLISETNSLKYASKIKRIKNIPIVQKFSGNPVDRFKKMIKHADSVVATGITVSFLRKNYGIEPETINPGVETTKFAPGVNGNMVRKKYEIDTNENLILSVGRLVPIKNIPVLIKAVGIIIDEKINCKLLLVGEGAIRRNLEKMISKIGLEKNVILAGRVAHDILPRYYAASDIVVVSSNYESFGIAALEAMTAGKPIVATRVGGIPLLVKDSKNGFLVPSKNPRMLAKALMTLLKNPDLKIKMGKEGRKMAEKRPDWTEQAIKMERLFKRLFDHNA